MDRDFYPFFTDGYPNELSEEERHKRIWDTTKEILTSVKGTDMEKFIMGIFENPDVMTNYIQEYQNYIEQNGYVVVPSDLPKCSARAAKHRSDGNLLYADKEYGSALKKFNESICCAPNDSEDLSIGYANRSAVFYTIGDHTLALANIGLAKQHNYPDRMMPKLLIREANCKQALDKQNPKANSILPSGLDLNAFLSDGICLGKLQNYNNSLVASQGLKAGDVILQEKPLMVAVDERLIFIRCNHCRSENRLHLIPCPNCVSAMFCNEKCLREGQRVHRFECGISGELSKLTEGRLGSRMFFYGLNLFDGDINKMMAFCRAVKTTESTFLDMDYSHYNPLKAFETFLAVKPDGHPNLVNMCRLSAVTEHSILMNVSSVRALVTNRAQEEFMLQCFAEYLQKAVSMSIQRSQLFGAVNVLYPMASLCNHSCDPNTIALDFGGQLRLIAVRPIRRGGHISISYGALYKHVDFERRVNLASLGFQCTCEVCDGQKRQEWMAKAKQGIAIAPEDKATISKLIIDTCSTTTNLMTIFNNANRKKVLQKFLQRYASVNPRGDFATVQEMFCKHLTANYTFEMNAVMRAKIAG